MKTNKTSKEWEVSNHKRKKDKESDSSIDLGAHKGLNNKNS
jgi:hypothetical protein